MAIIGKKLAAVLLLAAMAIVFLSISGTKTAYAEADFNIIPNCGGLQEGNAVIGESLSFDPEKIIESNDDLMEAFFTHGEPMIFSYDDDPEGQSFRHIFSVDDDGICRWDLTDNIGCAGETFRICFRFGNGSDDTKTFSSESIRAVAKMESVPVDALKAKTYTGVPLTQDLSKIVLGEMTLTEGIDYEVEYQDNINAGAALVLLHGKGNYIGTKIKTFVIEKADNPLAAGPKTAAVKYSKLKKKAQTLAVTKVISFTKEAEGEKAYTLSSAKKGNKSFKKYFKINKTSGTVTVKKGLKKGSYKVKVKVNASGNDNYKSAMKNVTFKINVK